MIQLLYPETQKGQRCQLADFNKHEKSWWLDEIKWIGLYSISTAHITGNLKTALSSVVLNDEPLVFFLIEMYVSILRKY